MIRIQCRDVLRSALAISFQSQQNLINAEAPPRSCRLGDTTLPAHSRPLRVLPLLILCRFAARRAPAAPEVVAKLLRDAQPNLNLNLNVNSPLPLARVRHRLPWLGGRQGATFL